MRPRLSLRRFSIFRNSEPRRAKVLRWPWLLLAALHFAGTAHALDPNRLLSQYIEDRWGPENGFPGGQVNSIAQTPDGYLWIATDEGLVRFDGLNFLALQQSNPAMPSRAHVIGLETDSEGGLWVRMEGPNVLRYLDGKFESVLSSDGTAEQGVTAMSREERGGILLSTLNQGTFRYAKGKLERVAPHDALPSSVVISIAETSDGRVWLGTRDDGLFYLAKGVAVNVKGGLPDQKINTLLPTSNGAMWIGTDNGLALWDGTRISQADTPGQLRHLQVLTMAKDRDGNIWAGTPQGLLRVNGQGASSEQKPTVPSSGQVTAVFEDREGDLWVGDTQGLLRLRDGAFVTYSTSQGLTSESNGPIYVDASDCSWFAPTNGGLLWMKGGQTRRVTASGLDGDIVYSIAGNQDDVWIGRQRGGLTHLHLRGQEIKAQTYTTVEGLAQNSVYAVQVNRDGSVWAGTLTGGVTRLQNGKFTTYTMADGLGSNTVASIEEGSNGTMWFATSRGLSELSGGHWRTYGLQDGLPSEDVISLFQDARGILWVGTGGGLALLSEHHVHTVSNLAEPLHEPILGIADDEMGSLWIATADHVLRVRREALIEGQLQPGDLREYGPLDGLHGTQGVRRNRSVIRAPHGRIWFSMNRGLSVINPRRAKDGSPPTIVHVEGISVDNTPVALGGQPRIPPSHQRVAINYTGLNLAVPDRIRYRYRLDGFDSAWSEPVSVRQAIYTNLGPGRYLFHVMASNGAGLWNGSEATIPFDIEPSLWQRWWFQMSCVLAIAVLVWLLYQLRMHQIKRQLSVRFEERLGERMRIAQDLHDTLLQGFLSASMQLHIALDQVPDDSPAKPLLARVLQLITQVNEEGRNALRGLRSSARDSHSLEQELSRVPEELEGSKPIAFKVIVDGVPQPLIPAIRDEVYRISREALVNAFRHSQAGAIEVAVVYAATYLQVVVRDDGCGIDPHVLSSGRDGHWGLPGMRERAESIGAKLRVFSRPGTGTEVELTLPGKLGYEHQSTGGFRSRLANRHAQKREPQKPPSRQIL